MEDDRKPPLPTDESDPSASVSTPTPTPTPPPPPPPRRYSIVSLARDMTPAGFQYLVSDSEDDGSSCKLLLPTELARALHDRTRHAEREKPSVPTPGVSASDASTAPTAATWTKPKRSDPHFVDPVSLNRGWPNPYACGWVMVWDPHTLREAVNRHNDNIGSADTVDRARDAAAFRSVLARGPWRHCSEPEDVESCIAALREELPHMGEFVGLLSDRLRLARAGARPFTAPPVLLVGMAGVGKTYAARRAADLLGLAFRSIDMSCAQTNSALHGSERHWSNARPGILFELVAIGASANPMILLDELDKVRGASGSYNPLGPLHLALEPSTARATRDQCTQLEFDTSHVLYVATANSLRGIPDSLLSRLHLIHCVQPDLRQSVQIARAIARRVVEELELADFQPISDRLVAPLAELSPRLLRRSLERAVARAVAAGRRHLLATDLFPGDPSSKLH